MFKKTRELPCVKENGFGHLVAHILGIQYQSKCFCNLGHWTAQGFTKDVKNKE